MTSCKKILKVINESSLEFYSLINKKSAKRKLLFQSILNNKQEDLKEMIPSISKVQKEKLIKNYPKRNCLDEIIDYYDYFPHLKEIRNVVSFDSMIAELIPNSLYQKKLNLYYTDLILDRLVEDFYSYEELKLISELKQEIMLKNEAINYKIIMSIKRFYMKKITI